MYSIIKRLLENHRERIDDDRHRSQGRIWKPLVREKYPEVDTDRYCMHHIEGKHEEGTPVGVIPTRDHNKITATIIKRCYELILQDEEKFKSIALDVWGDFLDKYDKLHLKGDIYLYIDKSGILPPEVQEDIDAYGKLEDLKDEISIT